MYKEILRWRLGVLGCKIEQNPHVSETGNHLVNTCPETVEGNDNEANALTVDCVSWMAMCWKCITVMVTNTTADDNLLLLHGHCHDEVHRSGYLWQRALWV